ncbi:scavenger receptor class F member 1-like isoform X1 [Haliotis rufescens]|uniref:scavenger receptor class F member 1-like isoform X1 n=1 Tax=Haliotis rufescens TaxID=6454 RepID=UPI00201F2785|nr:scavenger receptor class F member 1-like isoform X1 [Haliotis rufescens]
MLRFQICITKVIPSVSGVGSTMLGLDQRLLPFFVVVQGYTVCKWGLHGEHCNLTCPQNCALLPPLDVPYCDTDTGKCSEGCQRGWHGDLCNQDCNRNCIQQTCNHQTGHCTLGCSGTNTGFFCHDTGECGRGWYGDLCQHPCSINCLEERCNHTTGACKLGCSGTYTGEFCNTTKVVNNKEDANSLDAVLELLSLNVAVAATVAGAVTLTVTFTVIVFLRWRTRKNRRKRQMNSSQVPSSTDIEVSRPADSEEMLMKAC